MKFNPLLLLLAALFILSLACKFPLAVASPPVDEEELTLAFAQASAAERLQIVDGNEDGTMDWMSYKYPEEQLSAGLYMQPMIATDITYGNAYRQDLAYSFRNELDTDQRVEMEVDIPKAFAVSVDELYFSMEPLEIIDPDPKARFGFSVPAQSSPVAYLLIRGPERALSPEEDAQRTVAEAMLKVASDRCTKTMNPNPESNEGLQGMCYFEVVQGYAGFVDDSLLQPYCEKIKGDWQGICLSLVRPDTDHCNKIENKLNNALCTGMFITRMCNSVPLEERPLCYAEGAIELKSVGGCAAIPDEDIRNDCVARVKGDPRYCEKIQDEELKAQCAALTTDKTDYIAELFGVLARSGGTDGMFSSDKAEAQCKSFANLTGVYPLIKKTGSGDTLLCYYGTAEDQKNDDYRFHIYIEQYASNEAAAAEWKEINAPGAVWMNLINRSNLVKENVGESNFYLLERSTVTSGEQEAVRYTLRAGELVGRYRIEYIEKGVSDDGEARWNAVLVRAKQLIEEK